MVYIFCINKINFASKNEMMYAANVGIVLASFDSEKSINEFGVSFG